MYNINHHAAVVAIIMISIVVTVTIMGAGCLPGYTGRCARGAGPLLPCPAGTAALSLPLLLLSGPCTVTVPGLCQVAMQYRIIRAAGLPCQAPGTMP